LIPEEKYRIGFWLCEKEKSSELITNTVINPLRIGDNIKTFYYVFYICRMFYFIEIEKKDKRDNMIFDLGNLKSNNTIQIPIVASNFVKQFIASLIKIK